MSLGSLGDIVFTVSTIKSLTFKDLTHTVSNRFHHHEIIGNKPITEFLGNELDDLTFIMELQKDLSYTVEDILEKLNQYQLEATPLDFTVGNKPFGVDKWQISSLSEAYDIIYKNGYIYKATVNVTLKEYISDQNFQPNTATNTLSMLKKGIQFYAKVRTVGRSATRGAYNSLIKTTGMNTMMNLIK